VRKGRRKEREKLEATKNMNPVAGKLGSV